MKNTKNIITYAVAGFLGGYLLFHLLVIGAKNNDEYNAHVCAVYGKQPDCKTPLEVK